MAVKNNQLPSRVNPDLTLTEQEFNLIEQARDITKQSRNKFVTKAAVERAKRIVYKQNAVEEALL